MKLILLKYISRYKILAFATCMTCLSVSVYAQKQKRSFGIMTSYCFSSAYFEKHDNIPSNEKINANYRIGVISGRLTDTNIVCFKLGLYYQYMSFTLNIHVEDLDPNYKNYLTAIKPEYQIIGLPVFMDWKIYNKKNFYLRLNTGLSFEISVWRYEESVFSNGESLKSRRLIADNDWRSGIPLVIGFGADVDLGSKYRIGIYPSLNFYMKKFNEAAEASYACTFSINLFLFFKR